MGGLEKIIDEILSDAKTNAKKVEDEANAKAEKILSDANAKAQSIKDAAKDTAKKESEDAILRAKSRGDVEAGRIILQKKRDAVDDVIGASFNRLLSLEPKEYFEYLERLLSNVAEKRTGEIILSPRDKERVTAEFENAASQLGLSISEDTRDIDGGFILNYGEIENNCSFGAIIDMKHDELCDMVTQILF